MNVILLAAGKDENFLSKYPIYLTEISSKTLLEHQINFLKQTKENDVILVINSKVSKEFYVKDIVTEISKDIQIVETNGETKGAMFSSLLASDLLNFKEELLVMNLNEYIDINLTNFIQTARKNKSDAEIVSFNSFHPRYSYIHKDEEDKIKQISFNESPSKTACSGLVWMKSTEEYFSNSVQLIKKQANFNKPLYFNEILNQFILNAKVVRNFHIGSTDYYPIKTEEHLSNLRFILTKDEKI